MSKLSETSLKLIKKLEELWNDREFVIGIMSDAVTEEERAEVLRFMETYDDVNVETVTVFAIRLAQRRDQSE